MRNTIDALLGTTLFATAATVSLESATLKTLITNPSPEALSTLGELDLVSVVLAVIGAYFLVGGVLRKGH